MFRKKRKGAMSAFGEERPCGSSRFALFGGRSDQAPPEGKGLLQITEIGRYGHNLLIRQLVRNRLHNS